MLCIATLLVGCSAAPDMEQQIDELYGKMTQEERIAQLKSMYMDDLFDEQGQLDTAKCRELIPNGIGHFSQFCLQQPRSPKELRHTSFIPRRGTLGYQHRGFDHLSATDRSGRFV